MNRQSLAVLALIFLASVANAAAVRERWGPAGIACTYPNTLRIEKKGKVSAMHFDLSALPKGAQVYKATLRNTSVAQPREAIEIYVIDKAGDAGEPEYAGKPLALEAPTYSSYDLTAVVRTWQGDPAKNLGLALARAESFNPQTAYLEICYEGTPKEPPPQVSRLKVVHHDGQTFLTWKELEMFQPAADKIVWVGRFDATKREEFTEPGTGFMDVPRQACIRQEELRRLQMFDVIDPPGGSQVDPKLVRKKGWPDVRYRVYRSKNQITAENIKDAELVGEAGALCAYDESMRGISSHGEYYDRREIPATPIPTYCLEDGKSITPGDGFYVYTAQGDGPFFYGVTVCKDGTENMAQVTAQNSLEKPVDEKKAAFKPVLQFVEEVTGGGPVRRCYKHYCWPAPPACNLPIQRPLLASLHVPKTPKEPFGLHVGSEPPDNSWLTLQVSARFHYAGQLGYNEGIGTFRAVKDSKVDYFDERYLLYSINGILASDKWKIDRNRVQIGGGGTAFALRHPEIFKLMWPSTRGNRDLFEINFDPKWNPGVSQLFGAFGPPDAAMTVDGLKAWDIVGTGWYLKNNPAKDVPFFFCAEGGKESGHAVEFGWQDDPMGWAAMRDGRVPYAGAWGGGRISKEVYDLTMAMPLNKTLPAFCNCSLDGNPGNCDPSDGDPWGQLNGYLVWDFQSSVDEAGRWEMTVGLAADCPQDACTVDITPRRCAAFKPKHGDKFAWNNKSVADARAGGPTAGPTAGKPAAAGKVAADQWGLVTLKQVTVAKGKNRIEIVKESP